MQLFARMSVKEETGFKVEDLTEDEHLALNWALAVVSGQGSMHWRRFSVSMKAFWLQHPDYSETTLARKRSSGLRGLLAKGIVEATKDGAGDYVPQKVHLDRLIGGSIILGEMS